MNRPIHYATTAGLVFALALLGMPETGKSENHMLLLKSATENAALTEVTLPIFKGIHNGKTAWHVITESSNPEDAAKRKVHYSPKMANARGSAAVQKVKIVNGMFEFQGTVDFAPVLTLVPGPMGFPPKEAKPGAIGDAFYTPLIELPDGTILNAAQIKNETGEHDRLIAIDLTKKMATFRMTNGFFEGKVVHYVSFNASDSGVATVEAVNDTPLLSATPQKGSNAPSSALTGLIPFANGQTGKSNPQRQGLSSALLGEGDPFNIVQEIPVGERAHLYSPMWDVNLALWTPKAVAEGKNVAVKDFAEVARLAKAGYVTGPDGAPWGALGIVVNCPIISIDN